MNEADDIRKAILSIIGSKIPLTSTWGEVKSIDNQLCTVTIDELDIAKILLGFDKSGIVIYPKVGSRVLVGFINNTRTQGVVLLVADTDHIELMGSNKGGLAVVEKLTGRYNKVEKAINDLKTILKNWAPVSNDGGATLKTAVALWASNQLIETQDNDISNNKIKHGDG